MFPCDASTLTFQRIDEDKKILIARTCFLKGGEKQVWREILHKISSSSSRKKTKTNMVFVIHVLSNWTNSGCGWKNFVDGQFTTKPKNRINWESQLNVWWEVYMLVYHSMYTITERVVPKYLFRSLFPRILLWFNLPQIKYPSSLGAEKLTKTFPLSSSSSFSCISINRRIWEGFYKINDNSYISDTVSKGCVIRKKPLVKWLLCQRGGGHLFPLKTLNVDKVVLGQGYKER